MADFANHRWFTVYLALTTVLAGALVMVIEVLGSRVIGPFFGVSLFVWTSLIAVTLTALALGYAVGGRLADRFSSPDALYGLLLLAGLLTLPIPALKPLVLEAALPLGLRAGALTASLLLFGPALFLLGCVTPYVARIAVREMRHLGKTIGAFYAASTVGSIMGTVLAGFFLIPSLGVSHVFVLSGGLLIALAVGYFVFFRRYWWGLLALVVPLASVPHPEMPRALMPDGTEVAVVHSRDSPYGSVKVIDYRHGSVHTRELVIDGLVQGGIDMATRESVYEYSYLLQWLPYAMNPAGKSCLVIGLGAGLVARWYDARGIATDAVDIDPEVVSIARAYFGLEPRLNVVIADARAFLGTGTKRYDYVVLDVFNGDTTPAHLLSVEALRQIKLRLAEDGILALNLMGSLTTHSFMTASIVRTLETVYKNIMIYKTFDVDDGDGAGNIVVIAHDGAPRPPDARVLARAQVHPHAEPLVRQGFIQPFRFPPGTPAMLLTDEFNPVDARDLWLKERVRRRILESTPPAVLHSSRQAGHHA